MDKAHGSKSAEDQVRRTGEVAVVQAVTKARRMKSPPKKEFRCSVPATDGCHDARTGRSIHYIRQRPALSYTRWPTKSDGFVTPDSDVRAWHQSDRADYALRA